MMPSARTSATSIRPARRYRPPGTTAREHRIEPPVRRPWYWHLYKQAAWVEASRQFLAESPWCIDCGKRAQATDHIVPHRGDQRLFWDRTNWASRCFSCHNRKSARERHPKG